MNFVVIMANVIITPENANALTALLVCRAIKPKSASMIVPEAELAIRESATVTMDTLGNLAKVRLLEGDLQGMTYFSIHRQKVPR